MNRTPFGIPFIKITVLSFILVACSLPGQTLTPQPLAKEAILQLSKTSEPVTQEPVEEVTEETAEQTEEKPITEEPPRIPPSEEVVSEIETFWSQAERQAIAAAIDRQALVDQVFEGRYIPAYHMVPAGYPYTSQPFLDKYGTRDLDLAIALLKEEGYTAENPLVFEIWYPTEHYGASAEDALLVIEEQLEGTGLIQVDLVSKNWVEYVEGFVSGRFPVFFLGWFPDFTDPENWLSHFGTCTLSPKLGVNYCDETLDALLLSAASSTDAEKRDTLYQEIGEFWAEEVPTIPLFWVPEFLAFRDGVEGIDIGPTFEFNYNIVRFGERAQPASGDFDTLIIGTTGKINSLDPQDAYSVHDWEILRNTGVPLLSYVPGSSELIPGAAADFPEISEGGKTYTFSLKEDATFADNSPLTAQDYVAAWERIGLDGNISGLIELYVDTVEAPDDQTVVYHLVDTLGFFPALAATTPFIPPNPNQYPQNELVSLPDELDGIGPYRMVSNTPGEQLVLEANDTYFGEESPRIPNVILQYFPDSASMSDALESGEIDIAWRGLSAEDVDHLESVEGVKVLRINAPILRFLVFNHTFMTGGGK